MTDFVGNIDSFLPRFINKLPKAILLNLLALINAIEIVRNINKYDIVITSNIKTTQLVALYTKLLHLKNVKQIVLELMLDEESNTIIWKLKRLFQRFIFSAVDKIFVSSTGEIETYSKRLGLPRGLFSSLHFHTNIVVPKMTGNTGTYILSAGRTGRDYRTFSNAVSDLPIKVVVISDHQSVHRICFPNNTQVLINIQYDEYLELVKNCCFVVVPLKDLIKSTGQVVILEAMALGKPVIASDTVGTRDYIKSGYNGILVPPNDAISLKSAILDLLNDQSKQKSISVNALQFIKEKCTFDKYVGKILDTAEEITKMAQEHPVRIMSNFQNLPPVLQEFSAQKEIQISYEPLPSSAQRFKAIRTFLNGIKKDLLILNSEEGFLYKLCFIKYLCPWHQHLLISVDILLKPPMTSWDRIACWIKGFLLKKVGLFILYFRDFSGYQKYYNIDPHKFIYVPFKVNQLDRIRTYLQQHSSYWDPSDGECVMAVGRSLRDLSTFIKAMANVNLPGMILRQSDSIMAQHGTITKNEHLPPNIKEVKHNGSQISFIQYISQARIVVIPRFSWDIKSTGISIYLMAMALRKCVIISHGPGTTELLRHDEAILVPPENVNALSNAISKAWNQTTYRKKIANNGQKYAFSMKDEKRLLWDIVDVCHNIYLQKR